MFLLKNNEQLFGYIRLKPTLFSENLATCFVYVVVVGASSLQVQVQVHSLPKDYEYECKLFIASRTNIKYTETTCIKDWQTYINNDRTKATGPNTGHEHKRLTPSCVAESDQCHAQHPLKMLGIDFSCGSCQPTSERIMVLNSWYQTDMSLYSCRYLFVGSKIDSQKWQWHI